MKILEGVHPPSEPGTLPNLDGALRKGGGAPSGVGTPNGGLVYEACTGQGVYHFPKRVHDMYMCMCQALADVTTCAAVRNYTTSLSLAPKCTPHQGL